MSDPRLVGTISIGVCDAACGAREAGRKRRGAHCVFGSAVGCALCLLCCVGELSLAMQNGEKVIRADAIVAERFELVGPNGKRTALLGTNRRGAARLSFYSLHDSAGLRLGVSEDGDPGVELSDAKDEMRLKLSVDPGFEIPSITLWRGLNDGPEILLTDHEAGPFLSLSRTGLGDLHLGLDPAGDPMVLLHRSRGKAGPSLRATADEQSISLLARNGVTRAWWTLGPDGSPRMYVRDQTGKLASIVTVTNDGSITIQKPVPRPGPGG